MNFDPFALPISDLVPHSRSMLLIDRLISADKDSVAVTCMMRDDSPFADADGNIPSWLGIELMAQAAAVFGGIHQRQQQMNPRVSFLISTRNLVFPVLYIDRHTACIVHATITHHSDSSSLFDCSVTQRQIICSAQLHIKHGPTDPTFADVTSRPV